MARTLSYDKFLKEELKKDPEFAMGFLSECFRDQNKGVFLSALKSV
jgi:DNA-binding phage protein